MAKCKGCDAEIPDTYRGRARVWCGAINCETKRKLAWANRNRPPCPKCGKPMSHKTGPASQGKECRECMKARRHEAREQRGAEIEAWWAEGLSMKAIAEKLGWDSDNLGGELDYFRALGYSLPYRCIPSKPKFPEQVPS